MKSFIYSLIRIILLVLIAFFIPFFIFIYSGEYKSANSALLEQENNKKVLAGYAYTYTNEEYKAEITSKVKSKILVLGSSRVMQFSSDWFNPEYSYYNAGGAIQQVKDIMIFMKKINYRPSIIILGIDQWWFNKRYIDYENKSGYNFKKYDSVNIFTIFINSIDRIYKDVIKQKIPFYFYKNIGIGITAKIKNNGFKYDGSYYYGSIYSSPSTSVGYKFGNTFQRIKKHTDRFQKGTTVDKNSFKELCTFFNFCKKNNITVISFLPPFPSVIYDKLQTNNYEYISNLKDMLPETLSKYKNVSYFDFSNGDYINSPPSEFIDGIHGGGATYLKILIKIKESIKNFDYCKNIDTLNYELQNDKKYKLNFHNYKKWNMIK